MNITNLILQLQSIQSDNTFDQQAISKAISLLEVGAVITVKYFINLPSASSNLGKLYYVEFDGLYFSDGAKWQSFGPLKISAWAWGRGGQGQLGDNTSTSKSSPVSVVGGFTDWCQIAAGACHTVAVRTNGTIWAWGRGFDGELGSGTATYRSSPVPVVGGFTDWCQVDAGRNHTAAVRTNGTLWAWGRNNYGQLGDGTSGFPGKSSPVSVIGGFTDWCQVSGSTGFYHTAAVRTNGTLWAWGINSYGRLGDGTTLNRSSPVLVSGGFTNWCQVSAGYRHTAALRTNGTVWAWGLNTSGQLGDNTITSKTSPVSVIGGFTDWCQVSAGYAHTAAVRTNGTLWAWGDNQPAGNGTGGGQLGDGTVSTKGSPVSVIGGFTDWCQVAAGGSIGAGHTAAIKVNRTGF